MLKSEQTGFIHYNYHSKNGRHDTIPAIENACHVLELLRTKQADKLFEAKFLLEKLIAFQVSSGNFPVYLHEYPNCYDGLTAFYMLAPFFHIQREFGSILKGTLKTVVKKLQTYCQTVPYAQNHHQVLLKASLGEPLEALEADTAAIWSDLLVAKTMTNQDLTLDALANNWHGPSQTFIGLAELQDGKTQAPTLLDLFMGKNMGDHPLTLRKALTQPLFLQEQSILSLIYRKTHTPQSFQKDFHLMRWDGLVCQNSQHHVTCSGNLQMDFTYTSVLPEKDDQHMELKFFYPHDGSIQPATTFKLGDSVHMGPFVLTFTLIDGQGDFYGHISRGNRPAQIRKDQTYDWQIGLRTIRRTQNIKLRVVIQRADSNVSKDSLR